jgi:hypothetical protein
MGCDVSRAGCGLSDRTPSGGDAARRALIGGSKCLRWTARIARPTLPSPISRPYPGVALDPKSEITHGVRPTVSGTGTTAHGSWFQNRAWRDIPSPRLHKPRFGGAFFALREAHPPRVAPARNNAPAARPTGTAGPSIGGRGEATC